MILSPIEIDPLAMEPPLEWARLFGNAHATEVEIGCGKGMFLHEVASRHGETNFLGVERAGKYYRKAVRRLVRTELPNVRLLRADGMDVLQRWITPRSIGALYVLFPDPWPKKRHQKRRLFRPEFLVLAHRALTPEGELRVATDHPEYGRAIRELLGSHGHLFEERSWAADAPDRLPTHYALKWQRQGRALWWTRYRVAAESAAQV